MDHFFFLASVVQAPSLVRLHEEASRLSKRIKAGEKEVAAAKQKAKERAVEVKKLGTSLAEIRRMQVREGGTPRAS